VADQAVYEASLKPESLRFKHCSRGRLEGLYEKKKKMVKDLGGRVVEDGGPLSCFPLWVKVAFLDEFIKLSPDLGQI